MLELYGFRGGPTYRPTTGPELFESAFDQPMNLGATFFDQAKGGVLESFGLGTAIRDAFTPQGNTETSLAEPLYGMAAIPVPGAFSLAKAAVQTVIDKDQPSMSEDEYKSSAYFRDAIPFEAGMTEARAAEQRLEGCFNLVKPGILLVDWVERLAARLIPASPLQPEWTPWPALIEAGVEPWQSYPTLLPNTQAEFAGYGSISAEAAIVHGLNFRPLEETVADLVAWLATNEQATTAGMTLAEEAALRQRVRELSPS